MTVRNKVVIVFENIVLIGPEGPVYQTYHKSLVHYRMDRPTWGETVKVGKQFGILKKIFLIF